MSVSPQIVKAVAKNARLQMTDQEIAQLTKDLSNILELFATIKDVAALESVSLHPIPLSQDGRVDRAEKSTGAQEALANVRFSEKTSFVGPKTLE